jgi:predicted TIM-barrel fold metal-dependent hydrolase
VRNDYLVVDADGHVVEPPYIWTERMDKQKWGDWIPHRISNYEPRKHAWFVGGEMRSLGGGAVGSAAGMDIMELMRRGADWNEGQPGAWDPQARVKTLDEEGQDAAVLYATNSLFFGPVDEIQALHNPEFVLACQQAYNDWVADYCKANPNRLFAMAAVPLQDIDLAIGETKRAVEKLGFKGVFVRPSAYIDELPFSHPVYDRFWATLQDLDVPIAFHPGVHVDTPGACRKFRLTRISKSTAETNMMVDEIHGGSALGQAVGNMVDATVTLGRLLMGGVCERFPRLKILIVESGGGWVASLIERMDEQVEAFPLEARWLKLLPSEYFKRQCWVSFDPGEKTLGVTAELLGTDRVLWASDFPHPDAKYPGVVDELLETIANLSEEGKRRILGENAVKAYNLPLKAPVRAGV